MHNRTNTIRNTLILATISIFISACTQPAEDPATVASKYWQLLQAGNTIEAEKLVTTNSRRALVDHQKRIESVDQLDNNNARTIVSTTITTTNPTTNYRHTETFDTVLVLQQGQWKVDIEQSTIPPAQSAKEEEMQQMAEELSQSMQENIESIDDAMNQGMRLLNDALRDGSKEMGDSLLKLMNELNSSMKESVDKMKRRREQQLPQQDQNSPDQEKGEGMI